jgi:hypothetical protein
LQGLPEVFVETGIVPWSISLDLGQAGTVLFN